MYEIKQRLFALKDEGYKNFHKKLMPTVDEDKIIGVRIPLLRKLAKELSGTDEAKRFLSDLPHKYYEENNLHAFLIEGIKDFDLCIKETDKFMPFIDNWATCDSFRPSAFKKNKEKLTEKIREWVSSDKTYTVRFAIVCLMTYFLGADYKKEYSDLVLSAVTGEYYVDMAAAWYFATALATNYENVIGYIEEGKLSDFVHNKTIQKARESFRIKNVQKEYLNTLKR